MAVRVGTWEVTAGNEFEAVAPFIHIVHLFRRICVLGVGIIRRLAGLEE